MDMRRRPRALPALLAAALALWGASALLQVFVIPSSSRASAAENLGRRGLIAATLGAAASTPLQAFAEAGVEQKLDIEGSPKKSLNGRWSLVEGLTVNGRGVFKKDDQTFYLVFGDCNRFVFKTDTSADCNGFGEEIGKNQWSFKGKDDTYKLKLSPVKIKKAGGGGGGKAEGEKAGGGGGGGLSLPEMPKFGGINFDKFEKNKDKNPKSTYVAPEPEKPKEEGGSDFFGFGGGGGSAEITEKGFTGDAAAVNVRRMMEAQYGIAGEGTLELEKSDEDTADKLMGKLGKRSTSIEQSDGKKPKPKERFVPPKSR